MSQDHHINLFISGQNKPGVLPHLMNLLDRSGARLFDIALCVNDSKRSLSIFIDVQALSEDAHRFEEKTSRLLQDLQSDAVCCNLKISFNKNRSLSAVDAAPPATHVITCFGPSITFRVIHEITSVLFNERIDIQKIRTMARNRIECIEITISSEAPIVPERLTPKFLHLNTHYGIDIAVQKIDFYRREKKLIVLDMDSTLTEIEVIDELAKEAGVENKVVSITDRAMKGTLSFPEALRERVSLLKGLPVEALERVYNRMHFTLGAKKLISILKKRGYRIAVLSGGFDYFTSRAKKTLGLDYIYSNTLEIENAVLTGKIIGEIVDGKKKATLMEEIAKSENIPLSLVIAVGDGANDLPMINRAGLGIAFDAKPIVRAKSPYNITHRDLSLILYLLGMTEKEIDKLTSELR